MARFLTSFVLIAALAGCGGGVTAVTDGSVDSGASGDMSTRTDTGSTGTDMGSTGTDMGSTGTDMGTTGTDLGTTGTDLGTTDDMGSTGTDMGSTGTDMGTTGTDSGTTSTDMGPVGDGAVMCMAGVMCAGFPGIDPTLRGSTGSGTGTPLYSNCVGLAHQTDCCGALRIYGANHAARGAFCPDETSCRMQYMSPASCSDNTITTDSGATTTNISQVRVACDPASPAGTCTCQTIVCTTDVCRTNSVPIGNCGP